MPQRRVSLYGTPLWDRMSRGQRIELSRHEAASVASVGIWFELILMQMLARYLPVREAYAAARANRQRHETLTWAATKVVSFFEELHLIDAVTRPMWRRAHLIA